MCVCASLAYLDMVILLDLFNPRAKIENKNRKSKLHIDTVRYTQKLAETTIIAITIKQTKALNKLQPLTCLPLWNPSWRERDTKRQMLQNTQKDTTSTVNAHETLHFGYVSLMGETEHDENDVK